MSEEIKDVFTFTTERPKHHGYYYVKWSKEEKPIKVYIRYYPENNIDSSYKINEHWMWARDAYDKDMEDIEVDVTEPELIQFSERVFA